MTPTHPLLTMNGVAKRFGQVTALRSVNLELHAGEVLALVGENGAGKSTLMKILSGAHPPDSGTILMHGQPYRPKHPLDARRHGVAMIYQELSIVPDLTVMENLLLGVEPGMGPFVSWSQVRRRAEAALADVGRSDICPDARARDLSVADLQLIEIARCLALGSSVLVLDEPTSSLTARDTDNLFALLRRLREKNLGIIYISHFLEEVRAISDRFTVLRDGISVSAGNTAEVADAQIIRHMVGRSVDDLYPRSARQKGEAVLQLTDVAGIKRPSSASLSLYRNEVLGIAGLVGAGRTELLRMIFGLDPVRRGQVCVASSTGPASPARRWQQSIGMVSEDRKAEGLALGLSIADNITLSRLPAIVRPSLQERACSRWIEQLGIKCRSPWQPVGELSGGNQQKVALARLLNHGVDLLLLDEPTRGVDIGAKAQIYQLIDALASQGCAVLVVSSYLPELIGICDRIAVMSRGILGDARPVSEWDEQGIMAEAIRTVSYGGSSEIQGSSTI